MPDYQSYTRMKDVITKTIKESNDMIYQYTRSAVMSELTKRFISFTLKKNELNNFLGTFAPCQCDR